MIDMGRSGRLRTGICSCRMNYDDLNQIIALVDAWAKAGSNKLPSPPNDKRRAVMLSS